MRKSGFIVWLLCCGFTFFAFLQTSKAAIRTVDTTSDNGALTACTAAPNDCSLRGAAAFSGSGDTIDFAPNLTGATITLGSIITFNFKGVNIIGPGADKLTISGNNTTSIMEFLQAQSPAIVSGVTIANANGVGGFNEGQGGAIETNNCPFPITFDGVVFRNNSASLNSGALLCLSTTCRVTNSTFTGNTAPKASTIYSLSSSLEMTNTTVSGNIETLTGWYGAIVVNGSGIIRNSTIVDNPGSANIYVTGGLRIGNSIVSGHPFNDIFRNGGSVTSEGNNIISRNFNVQSVFPVGSPNANGDYVSASGQVNPQLAPLANYGGATPTHALLSNSPALNHGNNCVVDNSCSPAVSVSLTTDQRGAARRVGTQVDIGAFESSISFNQSSLPNGNTFFFYDQQISVTRLPSSFWMTEFEKAETVENLAPFTFETVPPSGATGLPPGLVLESNGQLHGMPTSGGTYSFFVKATDQADGAAGVNSYTVTILAPTAANVSISGKILTPEGRGLANARVILTDSNGNSRTAVSNSFGYYRFNEVAVGDVYIVTVSAKRYQFSSQVIAVFDEMTELNLTMNE